MNQNKTIGDLLGANSFREPPRIVPNIGTKSVIRSEHNGLSNKEAYLAAKRAARSECLRHEFRL